MDGNTFFFGFEPEFMAWLQKILGDAGAAVAGVLTLFGEELFLIAILGFIYWCYDKEFGKLIGVNIVTAVCLNPFIKNIFLRRRPYMDHLIVKCLKAVKPSADIYDISAQGYSFPSGHSMNSACVFGTFALEKKPKIFKIIAFVLPLIVGFSRIALGVHYPTDVLVGWVVGAAVCLLLTRLQKKIKRRWILHLCIFVPCLTGVFFCKTDDYYTALGVMAGLFVAIPFEEKFVNFKNTRSIPFCILRLIGGFGGYGILSVVLKLPFSEEFLTSGTSAAYMVRACRYFIIVFLLIGLYPKVFGKVEGLLSKKKEVTT